MVGIKLRIDLRPWAKNQDQTDTYQLKHQSVLFTWMSPEHQGGVGQHIVHCAQHLWNEFRHFTGINFIYICHKFMYTVSPYFFPKTSYKEFTAEAIQQQQLHQQQQNIKFCIYFLYLKCYCTTGMTLVGLSI